jgi:hypothetical protein
VAAVVIPAVHEHRHSGRSQPARNRAPEAIGRACDQNRLLPERSHDTAQLA